METKAKPYDLNQRSKIEETKMAHRRGSDYNMKNFSSVLSCIGNKDGARGPPPPFPSPPPIEYFLALLRTDNEQVSDFLSEF